MSIAESQIHLSGFIVCSGGSVPLAAVISWHELWRGDWGWSAGERAARDPLARGEICDSAVPPALPGFLSP
ncbi:hypothetical protein VTN00DRAFT_3839 [Thermoascus crustaceus]|uniref:uncharacterized protein n=1 Tax=Thermoascus crustaceus TaxID=5088 RepID=UPI0037430DC5